jgi:electron transport complex protein RnfC
MAFGTAWHEEGPAPNAFLPNEAIVLLKQHEGKAARCVVHKGEFVREGAIIGRSRGPSSSNVHAPIPGIVKDIRDIALSEGGWSEAVVIALEGSFDRLGRRPERYLWRTMSRHDILHSLEERGVVETEWPGRPINSMIAEPRSIDMLILNAIESEPYLNSETALVRDKWPELLDGLEILRKVTTPDRTIIAVSAGKTELPQLPADGEGPQPEILEFRPRYPQDLRNQILEAIGGTRMRTGPEVLIIRPSTAFAVYEAIVHVKPMLERYVTVGGGAVKKPAVLKARIGTSIGDLIEECGGFIGRPSRLIIGGPFRGRAVHDLDVPITKTTSAILALTESEIGRQTRHACIRCGRCSEGCPESLDPDLLFRLLSYRREAEAISHKLGNCTLCGICGHVCPSRVPLVAAFSAHLGQLESQASEARP